MPQQERRRCSYASRWATRLVRGRTTWHRILAHYDDRILAPNGGGSSREPNCVNAVDMPISGAGLGQMSSPGCMADHNNTRVGPFGRRSGREVSSQVSPDEL